MRSRCQLRVADRGAGDHHELVIVLVLVLQHHADGSLPHFSWIPLSLAVHDSILSMVGASSKAGAVHLSFEAP